MNYDKLNKLILESTVNISTTLCKTLGDNVCEISKGKFSVIVGFNDNFVVVTTTDMYINDQPFILLASQQPNKKLAYEKWLHVIGKMMVKEMDSKYFGNRRTYEHLNNGRFDKSRSLEILEFAKSMLLVKRKKGD